MTIFWFMRMRTRNRNKVEDYSEELWQRRLVGVLYGTWSIYDVLNKGKVEEDLLLATAIQEKRRQPEGIEFSDKFLQPAKRFLCEMQPGHVIVTTKNRLIRIGTLAEGYRDDPKLPRNRGKYKERFKCRPLEEGSMKEFDLNSLPASYRLISSTGQGSVQRVRAYEHLVKLLHKSCSEKDVHKQISEMSLTHFLDTLSDKQWEVLCDQYLRDTVGFRSLLLAVGGTLKDIDLCGVDRDGKRILAQCKNNSTPRKAKDVAEWLRVLDPRKDDSIYFFNRGGIPYSISYHL